MERRCTPYLKKQHDYDKDHRVHAEYPHAFRRKWPKKKVIAIHRERKRVLALTQKLLRQNNIEDLSPALLKTAKPQIDKKKTGVVSLRAMTQWKLKQRQEKYGARLRRHGQRVNPRS